jgi:hypothetical protein
LLDFSDVLSQRREVAIAHDEGFHAIARTELKGMAWRLGPCKTAQRKKRESVFAGDGAMGARRSPVIGHGRGVPQEGDCPSFGCRGLCLQHWLPYIASAGAAFFVFRALRFTAFFRPAVLRPADFRPAAFRRVVFFAALRTTRFFAARRLAGFFFLAVIGM